MKKILSILLVLVMVGSSTVGVFAQSSEAEEKVDNGLNINGFNYFNELEKLDLLEIKSEEVTANSKKLVVEYENGVTEKICQKINSDGSVQYDIKNVNLNISNTMVLKDGEILLDGEILPKAEIVLENNTKDGNSIVPYGFGYSHTDYTTSPVKGSISDYTYNGKTQKINVPLAKAIGDMTYAATLLILGPYLPAKITAIATLAAAGLAAIQAANSSSRNLYLTIYTRQITPRLDGIYVKYERHDFAYYYDSAYKDPISGSKSTKYAAVYYNY